MDKKINYKKLGILWLVAPVSVFLVSLCLYPIIMKVLSFSGVSPTTQLLNRIAHTTISMITVVASMAIIAGIPLGIYYLSKHSAEQPIKIQEQKPPKSWYKRWWLVPLILVLVFFTWACTKEPNPEVQQALEKSKQKEAEFEAKVMAKFPEIQKEIPGLREKDGVECFNGKACWHAIVLHFDNKPENVGFVREKVREYTTELLALRKQIEGDEVFGYRVISTVKEFELYTCKSEFGNDSISCGVDN